MKTIAGLWPLAYVICMMGQGFWWIGQGGEAARDGLMLLVLVVIYINTDPGRCSK